MKFLKQHIFFALIVLVFAYINTQTMIEKFTPKIRQMYRPAVRNARIALGEGFHNKASTHISSLFKKFGIV